MIRTWAVRLSWLAAFLAAVFFVYAAVLYSQAGAPIVASRHVAALPTSLPRAEKPPVDPGRYESLAGGRIFFGEPVFAPPAGPVSSPSVYVSALVVRGIVLGNGQPPVAILTRAGAAPDGESWTVRVGQTVLGEEVAAIKGDSVVLRKKGQETVLVLPK